MAIHERKPGTHRNAVSLTLIFAALAAGCAINPVTGERELALISEEQEVAMGAEAAQQVSQSIGLVDDSAMQQYVSQIGVALAADSERPELPWEFAVVDDPTPNAFALPGGYIFITRGLMNLMTSEAELAAVLGHEIGHVTARHSVQQLSRAQIAQLGLGLGAVLSPEIAQLGELLGSGVQLLFLRYGRDAERQADELGFGYALDEGYEPGEAADVFRALLQSSELAGRSPLPNWLASHPSEPERIAAVEERVAAIQSPPANLRTGREEYLGVLDGTIYGDNPRNGYFEGDWFYHPELVFRFAIPENWQRQNLPAVVQGVAPEQDAAVQLGLVEGAPVEAARQFFSQQNVAELASSRDDVNGLPAVVSRFQAQGQNGIVEGFVSHVSHGGATYRIVGYAPDARFAGHADTLERIVTSFARVTDREVLNAEPRRVEIVELPRAMTFAEFVRQYPSPISAEELALINQVYEADETIAAGTPMKRVVG
jgi:predicted Zn-dependent protease